MERLSEPLKYYLTSTWEGKNQNRQIGVISGKVGLNDIVI